MKFSVITVCFNAQSHIGKAVVSLSRQTSRDFEWIVIDGGSTDETLNIVRETSLPVRILSEPDQGIYDAMNKGIRMAKGEYLFFLNADDSFASPDVLEVVAEELSAAKGPDVLVGRIWHELSDRRILRDFSHLTYRRLLIDSICHQATFCRKDLMVQSGGFNLNYKMCADYDWFLRVTREGARMSFTKKQVAVFNGSGAHVRNSITTKREIAEIRRSHLGASGVLAFGIWRYIDHYWRRLMGLAPRGYLWVESA